MIRSDKQCLPKDVFVVWKTHHASLYAIFKNKTHVLLRKLRNVTYEWLQHKTIKYHANWMFYQTRPFQHKHINFVHTYFEQQTKYRNITPTRAYANPLQIGLCIYHINMLNKCANVCSSTKAETQCCDQHDWTEQHVWYTCVEQCVVVLLTTCRIEMLLYYAS